MFCHGVARGVVLKEGDLISIDSVVKYNDCFADTCVTYIIGNSSLRNKILVQTTYESMWQTIELLRDGVCIGDLGYSMEQAAKEKGFSVNRQFAGHGIGKNIHEDPKIAFHGNKGEGVLLKEGMCITIEPMIADGNPNVCFMDDGWSAKLTNGGYSAHFEHTVFIKKDGYKVLTYNKFDLANKKIREV